MILFCSLREASEQKAHAPPPPLRRVPRLLGISLETGPLPLSTRTINLTRGSTVVHSVDMPELLLLPEVPAALKLSRPRGSRLFGLGFTLRVQRTQ